MKESDDGVCQAIGLIRQSCASWVNSRSSFFCETHQRSETTSHQKWQENWLQYKEQSTICGSWFISEFFLNCTFTHFSIIFTCDVNRHTESPVTERSEVEVRVESFGETRCMKRQKPKTKTKRKKEVEREIMHGLTDWPQEFRENLVDESTSTEPWRDPEQGSQDTSKSSLELTMEPRAKVEPGSGKHSKKYAISEGPKLWCPLDDENNKGFLQKTCWYSCVQSGTFWWLDYSGSRSSQWRKWIAERSSTCSRRARLGHPMDPVVSVQNKKNLKKHKGVCKSSWSQIGSL